MNILVTGGTGTGATFVLTYTGTAGSTPSLLTNVNGELYFVANNGGSGSELWESNGVAAGTLLVALATAVPVEHSVERLRELEKAHGHDDVQALARRKDWVLR